MSVNIFFCHAHKDEPLLTKLKTHLRPLQRQGLIDVWHDRNISAGTEWEREISQHIDEADIILLLISPDFIDSDYCYSIEMKRALERRELGEAHVIPIILRPVDWEGAPFNKLQTLPKDAKPVTSRAWRNADEAFSGIAENIRKVINEISTDVNSSNEKREPQPPESFDFTQQNNDQVYQIIIKEWVRRTELDNWAEWSSRILTNRPALSTERDDNLILLSGWLFGRIWPKRYPVLDEAFINFRRILQDFYQTFHKYAETREGEVFVFQFYKKQWNSPTYTKDLILYKYHVVLIHDLMLELTRAANYICDAFRQFIDPGFRLLEGKVLVERDFVFYENFDFFDYELFLTEYRGQERILQPYPGLEQFKIDRENRDVYFGDII